MTRYDATPDQGHPRDHGPAGVDVPGEHPELTDGPADSEPDLPDPPRPINWNRLTAEQAQTAWHELDAWVDWLRRTYGLPAAIIPPAWHRHPELVWELSALHLHWLGAYDPEQHGSAPIGWHRDFADTRERLRDWVATCGTNLGRDRPTRQTIWPGEPPDDTTNDEVAITNRRNDFHRFVAADVDARRIHALQGTESRTSQKEPR
ncbi:MAG: hypothetical protein KG028_05955 [Actinobacteria bacterium]|jgi:hypothetical protein|nr:hypothetical protein [Actinomycetota bacterium]